MKHLLLRYYPWQQRLLDPQGCFTTGDQRILLTFDDGPHPVWTPQLLDLLAKHDLQACFFLRGDRLELHPEVAQQTQQAGHQLALHSMHHYSMLFYSTGSIRQELTEQLQLFESHDFAYPRFARPPYGYLAPAWRTALRALGLKNMLWSFSVRDYRAVDRGARIRQRLLTHQRPGDIILLHDYSPAVPDLLRILPEYLQRSLDNGLRFVTTGEEL